LSLACLIFSPPSLPSLSAAIPTLAEAVYRADAHGAHDAACVGLPVYVHLYSQLQMRPTRDCSPRDCSGSRGRVSRMSSKA
jgi:hypothetical protein